MEDYKLKMNAAIQQLHSRQEAKKAWSYSIIGEFDNKPPYTAVRNISGDKALASMEETLNITIRQIKPDRVKIITYDKRTKDGEVIDTWVIECDRSNDVDEQRAAQEKTVTDRINELIEKNNQFQTENQHLSGLVEKSNQSTAMMKQQHNNDLTGIMHQMEIDRKNDQIAKLTAELSDLTEEHKEALGSLDEFQKIYAGEEKMQSGARMVTQVMQGVMAVAPGLMGWAQKTSPALGSFATALVTPPSAAPQIEQSASDDASMDFNSAQFQQIQYVLNFAKSLSDGEMVLLVSIMQRIEADKGLLLTITELTK